MVNTYIPSHLSSLKHNSKSYFQRNIFQTFIFNVLLSRDKIEAFELEKGKAMNGKEKAFYTKEQEQSATWLSQYWESVSLVWDTHLLLKSVSLNHSPLTSHQQSLF